MHHLGSLWLTLCFCLVMPMAVRAQERSPSPNEKQLEAERQAVGLLNEIAGSIPNLRSTDNRIYLEAAVADLMWTRDEKRARSLYELLTAEIGQAMAALEPGDQRSYQALSFLQQQRRETVERMARRDSEMALAFLRSTRPPVGLRPSGNDYNTEANLELYLAGLIASKDPNRALQLARASLKKGVTYPLIAMLPQIAIKNPEAARDFYAEIVDKLKTADLMTNYDSANAAWSLLGTFQPPQANEDTYRSLIELLATSTLSVKPDVRNSSSIAQTFSGQLSGYLSQFEKYAPGRVAALKQWSEQIKRSLDPGSRVHHDINEIAQKGTVDDILALAGKYPAEFHHQIYQQAAYKAGSTGDPGRARQIISDLVSDPNQRRQMLDQLENQLFWSSVNENKVTEARQVIERIKNSEQRFQLLVGLALKLINRREKKQAAALLSEAATLSDSLPSNANKLQAKLQLAQAYSTVEPQQSVALLQSVIVLSNQLVAAAAVLDGFENSYLKEGEWMKRGYSNLSNVVTNIQQNLGQLARVDAEGARSLAEQIERPEIRLMAQLEIVKTMLSPNGTNREFSRLIIMSSGLH